MNDYNNGEIWGWNGGECPVHPESEVMIWLRKSYGGELGDCRAGQCRWEHFNDAGDIIAFQVTEPKVIWVNEYPKGCFHGYLTKEDAETFAYRADVIRIAAKYVEAKE